MAKATSQTETVTTTTVTLTLTETEALNLQRLLGSHITGEGNVRDSLVGIWYALREDSPEYVPPLFVKGSSTIYVLDKKEKS